MGNKISHYYTIEKHNFKTFLELQAPLKTTSATISINNR